MSKQCNSCGAMVDDGVMFCTNCGNMVPDASAAEPVASEGAAPAKTNPVANILKNPKMLITAAVAVVAVVLVVVLVVSLFGGGYKTAINTYEAYLNGNSKKVEKMAPEAYWEYYEDILEDQDKDMDDVIDSFEDSYKDRIDDYEDDYGDKVKISIKYLKKEALKDNKVNKIGKALDEKYDIDKNEVKKAYTVKVEYKVKGKEDYDYSTMDLTVVKIGSKWYVINYYESDGEVSVSFKTP